jgi:hypothetical protein
MEVGAKVEIIAYENYDPLLVRVKVTEGFVQRGHYVPELGVVEQIFSGGGDVHEAEADGTIYVLRARVSDQGFIRLDPSIQFKILQQLTARLHTLTGVLSSRFAEAPALPPNEADKRVIEHRPPRMPKDKYIIEFNDR